MRTLALSFSSLTVIKWDVSSAKKLALDFNFFGRSFMKMRKDSGPNITKL